MFKGIIGESFPLCYLFDLKCLWAPEHYLFSTQNASYVKYGEHKALQLMYSYPIILLIIKLWGKQ